MVVAQAPRGEVDDVAGRLRLVGCRCGACFVGSPARWVADAPPVRLCDDLSLLGKLLGYEESVGSLSCFKRRPLCAASAAAAVPMRAWSSVETRRIAVTIQRAGPAPARTSRRRCSIPCPCQSGNGSPTSRIHARRTVLRRDSFACVLRIAVRPSIIERNALRYSAPPLPLATKLYGISISQPSVLFLNRVDGRLEVALHIIFKRVS